MNVFSTGVYVAGNPCSTDFLYKGAALTVLAVGFNSPSFLDEFRVLPCISGEQWVKSFFTAAECNFTEKYLQTENVCLVWLKQLMILKGTHKYAKGKQGTPLNIDVNDFKENILSAFLLFCTNWCILIFTKIYPLSMWKQSWLDLSFCTYMDVDAAAWVSVYIPS